MLIIPHPQSPYPTSTTRSPFTLIELLVVITIMIILLSLLLPALIQVRKSAQKTRCIHNQSQIATAIFTFAHDYEGRAPGRVWQYSPTSGNHFWANILNTIIFRNEIIQRWGNQPQSGKLYCPSIVPYKFEFPRAYVMNIFVNGGYYWAPHPPQGAYGLLAELPLEYPTSQWKDYSLGAPLNRFTRPTETFLLLESERTSDTIWPQTPIGPIILADSPDYPTYSGGGGKGSFAFRHQWRGVFTFLDGHIETLKPSDPINEVFRFDF